MRCRGSGRHAAATRLACGIILALLVASAASACLAAGRVPDIVQFPASTANTHAGTMKIRLRINGQSMTATLDDTPSARDFLTLLPLTLKLDDYNATEKIATLPRKLSTQGAPVAIEPRVGDFAYYAPWGNLALFYRDFGRSPGLIRLGRFDADVEVLDGRGSLDVTIEGVPR